MSAASATNLHTRPENIQLSWLVRLRWLALGGQILLVSGVDVLLGIPLPWVALLGVLGTEAASNLVCAWVANRHPVTERWLVAVLALDIVLLTALLHFTGGPVNPFTFLYLVHIALAAVVVRATAAWTLTGLGLLGFGLLFVLPPWPEGRLLGEVPSAHQDHLWLHLQGMYVAFGLSAVLLVYFIQRVRQALAQREQELGAARDLAARQARFAALATMVAGAAHELGTPLATIAVAARELERVLDGVPEGVRNDLALIRQEVRRCQHILQQMALATGQGTGESVEEVTIGEIAAELVREFGGEAERLVVDVPHSLVGQRIGLVRQAFLRALANLVRNGLQASPAPSPVRVEFRQTGNQLQVEVVDRGAGMSADILARAGEPFFSTKPPGKGIGLGLFLARTMVQQMGGDLDLDSSPGMGTRARVHLPWPPATQSRIVEGNAGATP